MHPRLDGAHAHVESRRGLRFAEVLEKAECDGRSLAGREPCQALHDKLLVLDHLGDRRLPCPWKAAGKCCFRYPSSASLTYRLVYDRPPQIEHDVINPSITKPRPHAGDSVADGVLGAPQVTADGVCKADPPQAVPLVYLRELLLRLCQPNAPCPKIEDAPRTGKVPSALRIVRSGRLRGGPTGDPVY